MFSMSTSWQFWELQSLLTFSTSCQHRLICWIFIFLSQQAHLKKTLKIVGVLLINYMIERAPSTRIAGRGGIVASSSATCRQMFFPLLLPPPPSPSSKMHKEQSSVIHLLRLLKASILSLTTRATITGPPNFIQSLIWRNNNQKSKGRQKLHTVLVAPILKA